MINKYGNIVKDLSFAELNHKATVLYLRSLEKELVATKAEIDSNDKKVKLGRVDANIVNENLQDVYRLLDIVENADPDSSFYVDKASMRVTDRDVGVYIYAPATISTARWDGHTTCITGKLSCQYIHLLYWVTSRKPLHVKDKRSFVEANNARITEEVKASCISESIFRVLYTVDTGYTHNDCISIIRAKDEDTAVQYFNEWWETVRRGDESLYGTVSVSKVTDSHIIYNGRV